MTIAINERICPNASCAGPDNNYIAASLNNISFETPSIDILQAYYGYVRMHMHAYNVSISII